MEGGGVFNKHNCAVNARTLFMEQSDIDRSCKVFFTTVTKRSLQLT